MASALTHLINLPNCVGVFASIPCGTWSAIRYHRPGPPVLRRLASAANGWLDETLGIKRADGSLPDAVATANLVAENMATVARAALERGKLFAYESPVSRAADSQFALKGREDHAEKHAHRDLSPSRRLNADGRRYALAAVGLGPTVPAAEDGPVECLPGFSRDCIVQEGCGTRDARSLRVVISECLYDTI